MASMWRKAMLYLGLGPDEEYDDHDVGGDHHRPAAALPVAPRRPSSAVHHDPEPSGSVRTLTPAEAGDGSINGNGGVGRADHARTADRGGRQRPAPVRHLNPPTSKPHVVGPTSFNDAQEVADKYKGSVPVILNLQGVERDLSRRIIDFASGLCYGLGGQMERVANQVYLLTPSDVEVSDEDRRRLHEVGLET